MVLLSVVNWYLMVSWCRWLTGVWWSAGVSARDGNGQLVLMVNWCLLVNWC